MNRWADEVLEEEAQEATHDVLFRILLDRDEWIAERLPDIHLNREWSSTEFAYDMPAEIWEQAQQGIKKLLIWADTELARLAEEKKEEEESHA